MGPPNWKKLHKFSYVAVLAGAVHYLLLVKAWPPEPILYVIGVCLLLLTRISWKRFVKAAA